MDLSRHYLSTPLLYLPLVLLHASPAIVCLLRDERERKSERERGIERDREREGDTRRDKERQRETRRYREYPLKMMLSTDLRLVSLPPSVVIH
jgi:hypothetical protein